MSITRLEPKGRAEVVDDAVIIRGLESTSPDVVAGARRHAERTGQQDVGDYVLLALDLGSKAMLLGSTTVDVEAISKAIGGLSGDVTRIVGEATDEVRKAVAAATDAENGTVATAVGRALEGLGREVTALVAGDSAPVPVSVEKAVRSVTDHVLEEVQRALTAQTQAVRTALSSDSPDSPLAAMRLEVLRTMRESSKELSEQIGELKTAMEVQKARAGVMERTAIKGTSYQEDVLEALERIANVAGDQFEATHDTVGAIAKCKTGDAVITLGEAVVRDRQVRIAAEAKDRTQSVDAWREELARACENRQAVAALGVVKGVEHMPGRARVKVIDRLNVLVAYDPAEDDGDLLLAALHLLRIQAACASLEGNSDEVDLAGVREHLEAAVRLVEDFDRVDRASSAAQRGLDDIKKHTGKLRQDLLERLERGLRLVGARDAA